MATIWETLATESRGSPVDAAGRSTLPGAPAHWRLLVRGTQTTVATRLRLKASTLHDQDWSAEPRPRSDWGGEVSPPDVTLGNHHSTRRNSICPAAETTGSTSPSTR